MFAPSTAPRTTPSHKPGTVSAALAEAARRLAPHSESARADAEILLGHVLNRPRHWPRVRPQEILPAAQSQRFRHLVSQRVAGIPIAYLTGRRAFWSLDLEVTPDVLIPRPETECLVEAALEVIPNSTCWSIADLGL